MALKHSLSHSSNSSANQAPKRVQVLRRIQSFDDCTIPPTTPRARPRSLSLEDEPSPPRLTYKNLYLLNRSQPSYSPFEIQPDCNQFAIQPDYNQFEMPPRKPQPKRTPSPVKATLNKNDDLRRLNAYNIFIHRMIEQPAELKDFIMNVIGRAREEEASPNAKQLAKSEPTVALLSEDGATSAIEDLLLFKGHVHDALHGIPMLVRLPTPNLNRGYLPVPRNAIVQETQARLLRPQPDRAIGYVTDLTANNAPHATRKAFTTDEDMMIEWFHLAPDIHFPFLTSQFKATGASEGQWHARIQSARDGVAMNNVLHTLFHTAYGQSKPTQTCHFSVTSDMQTVILWVHWRMGTGPDTCWDMEKVYQGFLDNKKHMKKVRKMLKNIVHWGMNERLESIRKALHLFWANKGNMPQVPPDNDTTEAGTATVASSVAAPSGRQLPTASISG